VAARQPTTMSGANSR